VYSTTFFFVFKVRIYLYLLPINLSNLNQMRFFSFMAVLFCAASSYAQDFKGYYVTESGKTVSGFFEDGDFNNYMLLKFKESDTAEAQNLPSDIVEYGINDLNLKYEKHVVKLDISKKRSRFKDPEWDKNTLFLNVIVSGNACLYSYTLDNDVKYFYKTNDKQREIEELINKKYYVSDVETAVNQAYRQQLYISVNCNNKKKVSEFVGIRYDKTELKDLFIEYNQCTGGESQIYIIKTGAGFKFTAFAGMNSTMFGVTDTERPADKGSDINYAFGAEVAYRFSAQISEIFFRAEYETLNASIDGRIDNIYNHIITTYDFSGSAVNTYYGYRYNFIMSPRNKLFMEGSVCLSFPSGDVKQNITIYPTSEGDPYPELSHNYSWRTIACVDFGIGYVFDKRYGISLRYTTKRDFLADISTYYKTEISRLGLNIRYTIN
jgi:hypothetical protein